jgi:heterotetrameric sarcosine oxidase gamma subunit
MSFEFLMPDAAAADGRFTPVARTPMEGAARSAGASFEVRHGWNLAVSYADPQQEANALSQTAAWADVSHLGKVELQGNPDQVREIIAASAAGAELTLAHAARVKDSWVCPLTRSRVLVICEPETVAAVRDSLSTAAEGVAGPTSVVDVSTVFAAMTVLGPLSREVFARFSALDLRPSVTPIGGLRPGSIARQPAILIREDEDRFLFLFGWGTGEYIWTVVSDAAGSLGGAPVGLDSLPPLGAVPSADTARDGSEAVVEEVSADA